MNPSTAAAVLGLRPAIEALIVRATESPDSLSEPPNNSEGATLDIIKKVSFRHFTFAKMHTNLYIIFIEVYNSTYLIFDQVYSIINYNQLVNL